MQISIIFKQIKLWSALAVGIWMFSASADAETLRVAVPAAPPGLGNPLSSTSISPTYTWAAIYDALTMIDDDGEARPWLAAEWENPDPLTWRFELRGDARFSNGRPVNAAVVKRVIDHLVSEASIADSVRRDAKTIRTAAVIDPLTIEITTGQPDPNLPRALAGIRIPDMDLWAELGRDEFARRPVGSGPFKVDRWGSAQISLSANAHAWRPPKVDKLELLIIPETSARTQALLAGRADIALQLGPDDMASVEAMGGRIHVRRLYGVLIMALQTLDGGPFGNADVRRALNMAVDRQAIIDSLLAGKAEIATQPAARGTSGHDPALEPYPYDPERARELLAQAGYPDGFDFIFEGVIGTGPNDAAIWQSMAADLARVGVRMTIRTISYPQLTSNVNRGNWGGGGLSMDFGTAPSLDSMRPFQLHSCDWHAAWFCDESIMPAIRAARTEVDDEKRLGLVRNVLRHYRDQASSLFLYDQIAFDGLNARVKNYRPRTILINYDAIRIEG